jgi:D-amino-acid dehydrogenase
MTTGCSYVNAGYITPSHIIPLSSPGMPTKGLKYMWNKTSPFYLKPRLELDLFSWCLQFARNATRKHVDRCAPVLMDFNLKSKELYKWFSDHEGLNFGYLESGLLLLSQTDKQLEADRTTGEFAQKLGLEVQFLKGDQIRQYEPDVTPDVIGGVLYVDDAILVPQAFMEQLAQLLTDNGVRILKKTIVERIKPDENSQFILTSSGEKFTFDQLLVTAGSWSANILKSLGCRLLLQPGKGYSFEIDNPGIRYPAILSERKVAVTPMGSKVRFGGTMELAGLNTCINRKRVDAIKSAAERYYPGIRIQEGAFQTTMQGMRPVSPDGMPYIGRLKKFRNVYLATGHAMMGMSLGPATGLLVSELMQDKPTFIDTTLFDPNRF